MHLMSVGAKVPELFEQLLGPLLTLSQDGTVLTRNEWAKRLFGYTSEEAVRKSYKLVSASGSGNQLLAINIRDIIPLKYLRSGKLSTRLAAGSSASASHVVLLKYFCGIAADIPLFVGCNLLSCWFVI